jgi:hypothetical protein
MSDNERAAWEWDRALDRLAAEVTTTAYAIALRHGAGVSWVDLQLGLWAALTRTVREWGGCPPGTRVGGLLSGGSGDDCSEAETLAYQKTE